MENHAVIFVGERGLTVFYGGLFSSRGALEMLNTKLDPADHHSLRQSISEWRPGGDGAIQKESRRTQILPRGTQVNAQWRLKMGDHRIDQTVLHRSVAKL